MQREHRDRDADQDPGRHAAFTVFSVTKRAAAGPTTIPTATMAFSSVGVALSAMPSASGTHSTSRKRSVTPAPEQAGADQEKRVCPSRHNVTQAVKLFVIARGRQEAPGAAARRGIYRLATTAPA